MTAKVTNLKTKRGSAHKPTGEWYKAEIFFRSGECLLELDALLSTYEDVHIFIADNKWWSDDE